METLCLNVASGVRGFYYTFPLVPVPDQHGHIQMKCGITF